MTEENKPTYFDPIDTATKSNTKASQKQDYFIPVEDNDPFVHPESIETTLKTRHEAKQYQFLIKPNRSSKTLKWLLIGVALTLVFILGWHTYHFFQTLYATSLLMGTLFGLFVLVLLGLMLFEAIKFFKFRFSLKRVDYLRDLAESFQKEKSFGQATIFIAELKKLYNGKPQQAYLDACLEKLPDYLNDEEIISQISTDFLTHLDREAKRLVSEESVKVATTVAVSQVAIIDALIVGWRAFLMVNHISNIYGLSQNKLGQTRLFIRIVKASLIASSSQLGIDTLINSLASGLTTRVVASAAQGVAMGAYMGRIGVEAMKQTRPIPFTKQNMPDMNLIVGSVSSAMNRFAKKHN